MLKKIFPRLKSKRPIRVLVAEDEPETAILILQFLESRGIRVSYAKDGQEALQLAQTQAPDLVLMDIKMPLLSGLEALAEIKSNATTKAIPVLMCTSAANVDDVEKSAHWGASGYITKPINFDFMWDKIQANLNFN